MSEKLAVILADSTSHALRIEKLLQQHNLTCKLVPVPRHLSSDCGVCVRINAQQAAAVRQLLQEHQVEFQTIEEV